MSSWCIMLRTEWRKPEVRVLIRVKIPPVVLILASFSKRFHQSKELETLQSAKLRIISKGQETRMNKTALQMFEERNEKACCLNCEKLIVKHTKTGHINFCGESEKIILDMFLDVGTNFPGCKYARKESADD
nr:MAG TPA: hypothetical protein [Bacteriophage sp.]